MAAGKFVIKKGRTGQFRFSLVGRNGQIVATSETYTTKASCMNGIKAVRTLASGAVIEDQTSKAWGDKQASPKAATKAAAKTAEKAIARAPAARAAKKAVKTAGGVVRPRGTAS